MCVSVFAVHLKGGIRTMRAKKEKKIQKMRNRQSSTAPFRTNPIASTTTHWIPIEPALTKARSPDFGEFPQPERVDFLQVLLFSILSGHITMSHQVICNWACNFSLVDTIWMTWSQRSNEIRTHLDEAERLPLRLSMPRVGNTGVRL